MLPGPGDERWTQLAPALTDAVIATMRDGLAVHAADGALVVWSPAAAATTGWDEPTARAAFPADLGPGLVEVAAGRWIDVRHETVETPAGLMRVTVFSDARQQVALRDAFGRLNDAATTDPLTGLPNRLLAEDRLRLSVEIARRDERAVGVLHVDLDRFKLINETLGNAAGDLMLREVGRRIRSTIAETDTVARIGDDGFVVLLHDLEDPGAAERAAAAVLVALRERFGLGVQDVYVGSSVGIALFPDHGRDAPTLFSHADLAMHRAKRNGGNTWCVYAPVMSETSRQRLSIAGDLQRALSNRQLVLHYQPQVDANSGRVVGAEALIRWHHPQRGLMLPDGFLDVAEEDGSIVDIDRWVLRTACDQIRRWDAAGIHLPTVGVNLSARTMIHGRVVEMVSKVLAATRLAPERLELEVSEHVVAAQSDGVEKTLSELKALGVQLAIDDFGIGYSSLGHLKRFPIDAIKLDRSFVIDVTGQPDPADIAILRAVVTMASDLDLRCIAEGVETVAQRKVLRFLQCHLLQGFLYSRPLSPREFRRRMTGGVLSLPSPVGVGG